MSMGKFGVLFGDRDHAATYIAGILACLLLTFMAAIVFAPLGAGLDRADTLKLFGGFFLGVLGFMFGSLKGNGSKKGGG